MGNSNYMISIFRVDKKQRPREKKNENEIKWKNNDG